MNIARERPTNQRSNQMSEHRLEQRLEQRLEHPPTSAVGRQLAKFLCLIPFTLVAACGSTTDRPEVITKLRALGVEQTPVNAKPGDTVNLTFYLAGNASTKITPEVLLDTQARYGSPVAVTPIDTLPAETSLGSLSLYSYRASFTVPTTDAVKVLLAKQGYSRLRYQVKFTASGDDENVVGDTIVYAEGAPQLSWTAPKIEITSPAATGAAGSVALEGSVIGTGDENNLVSWFVSAGTVKNRGAKSTLWQSVPAGTHTVFMTVRGRKSGAFAIKSQAVTVN
jgi:hypothetical protein